MAMMADFFCLLSAFSSLLIKKGGKHENQNYYLLSNTFVLWFIPDRRCAKGSTKGITRTRKYNGCK
jgi:hypothetical protein